MDVLLIVEPKKCCRSKLNSWKFIDCFKASFLFFYSGSIKVSICQVRSNISQSNHLILNISKLSLGCSVLGNKLLAAPHLISCIRAVHRTLHVSHFCLDVSCHSIIIILGFSLTKFGTLFFDSFYQALPSTVQSYKFLSNLLDL